MDFGSKLKELRTEKGLTQADLAKKLKLSKANISKYESNLVEPNLDTLAMVSLLFDVSINYLLDIPEKDAKSDSLPKSMQSLIDACSKLTDEELKNVTEYIDFLKSKRKK